MSGDIQIKPGDKGILYIILGILALLALVYYILQKTVSNVAAAFTPETAGETAQAITSGMANAVIGGSYGVGSAFWQSGADAANAANQWYQDSGLEAVLEPIDPFNSDNWLATDIVNSFSNPVTEAIKQDKGGVIHMPNGIVLQTAPGDFIDPALIRYWEPNP